MVERKIGNRIKYLRKQNGLTQRQLGERIGLTNATIGYYERHERCPSPDIVKKLAYVFHVSADYLLGIDDKKLINVSDLNVEEVQLIMKMIDRFGNNSKNKNHAP